MAGTFSVVILSMPEIEIGSYGRPLCGLRYDHG